jgi:putative aminopeptidase FrvX
MKAHHLQILRSVLERPTAPFVEDRVADLVHQTAARLDHVRFRRDPEGNLVLRYKKGDERVAHPIVVQAHMDHPGFIAQSQTRTGRLTARFVGLVDREVFADARVRFHGHEPVRARVVSVRRKDPRRDGTVVLQAEGRVEPGTIGMWDVPACRIRGDVLEARAADDLVGVAAVLCLFEELSRKAPDREVLGVFTRAEEAGFVGALGLVQKKRLSRRHRVITIECSMELPTARRGDGPVLRVGDRRSTFSPRLVGAMDAVGRRLRKRSRDFRYQRRLMDGGVCETTVFSLFGYEAACLCLPLGNYHNMTKRGGIGPERISLRDLAGTIRYLEEIVTTDLDLDERDRMTRERLSARYRAKARDL